MKKQKIIWNPSLGDYSLWHYERILKGMEASPKREHLFLSIEGMKKKIAERKQKIKTKAVHGK